MEIVHNQLSKRLDVDDNYFDDGFGSSFDSDDDDLDGGVGECEDYGLESP